MKLSDLSRLISHALRHEPWLYELELDDEGWVSLDALIKSLRQSGGQWANLQPADVSSMIDQSEKQRHEIKGNRIRALYGHSTQNKLKKQEGKPPPILFHGTSPSAAALIQKDGIQPMSRQYVHLSVSIEMANSVGSRKAPSPIIFEVDAARGFADGVKFYEGNEHVWLADFISEKYLRPIS